MGQDEKISRRSSQWSDSESCLGRTNSNRRARSPEKMITICLQYFMGNNMG